MSTAEGQAREQIQRTRDADQARYEAMAARATRPIQQHVEVIVDDYAWRMWQPASKSAKVFADYAQKEWQ